MYGIYCTEARGREAARGLRAINAMHPDGHELQNKDKREVGYLKQYQRLPFRHQVAVRTRYEAAVDSLTIATPGCGLLAIWDCLPGRVEQHRLRRFLSEFADFL